ncbi:DUF1269 domain-containing protein [Roseofilum sp. BLCC_M91]|uniref:DUF1269 domain-containing protein n=1 Tax=Roseofilum halophilum BLCC-M91 TaxID=3022259 RepID=A0ABT7BKL6_9CYAN|nr:DUF1269 domain-containing protein [Roseofilum halophilum]MDJ1179031.1 DUF1269 domain-containing protein [Roseofilum halophilum BLCC-M91]
MNSELVVLAFDNEADAYAMRDKLAQLQKEYLIELGDAAIVKRNSKGKVKIDQVVNLVGAGALGGAFWGLLIGLLFFVPWFGAAVGAITGALSGKATDYGVDDNFIKKVGETIEPGHAALFLLIRKWTEDKVMDQITQYNAKVLRTSLSREDEEKLSQAFSKEQKEEVISALEKEE